MSTKILKLKPIVMLIAVGGLGLGLARADAARANLDCKLHYSLTGWSAIYKHAEGNGVVTCEDGSSMRVSIEAKGGGLTAGKSRIDNGTGRFSDVRVIDDVLGSYADSEAHIGVVKSGAVHLLTKGTVSLALAGAGEGVDIGVDIGKFSVKRAR